MTRETWFVAVLVLSPIAAIAGVRERFHRGAPEPAVAKPTVEERKAILAMLRAGIRSKPRLGTPKAFEIVALGTR